METIRIDEHIIAEFEEGKNRYKIRCLEGHWITDWVEVDEDSIADFLSFKIAYCPANTDLDKYYCLTDEQNNNLLARQEEYWRRQQPIEPNEL